MHSFWTLSIPQHSYNILVSQTEFCNFENWISFGITSIIQKKKKLNYRIIKFVTLHYITVLSDCTNGDLFTPSLSAWHCWSTLAIEKKYCILLNIHSIVIFHGTKHYAKQILLWTIFQFFQKINISKIFKLFMFVPFTTPILKILLEYCVP